VDEAGHFRAEPVHLLWGRQGRGGRVHCLEAEITESRVPRGGHFLTDHARERIIDKEH
jgi:hypothetical protein